MRISDWSSDVCSSDLAWRADPRQPEARVFRATSVLGHVQLAAAAEPCHPLQIGRVAPDLVAVVAPERRRQPPAAAEQLVRSEESRVGKEWVSKCRFRWLA